MSEGDSVALSANWLRPEARPYVWDCTAGWDKPPRPKDFHAPVKGRLVSSFFRLHLQHYADQEILSYFCLGVRYKGMVDMQTFWPPPMLSLRMGLKDVEADLRVAVDMGWSSLHDFPPQFHLGAIRVVAPSSPIAGSGMSPTTLPLTQQCLMILGFTSGL